MTNLVIFDIDKTLVKKNLHEIIIGYWVQASSDRALILYLINLFLKLLPYSFIKRRFEYFAVIFIKERDIRNWTSNIIDDDELTNIKIIRRISLYKKKNIDIALVTAAPEKVVKQLSLHLEIPVYSSQSILGIIYDDLLAKKIKIYNKLEQKGYKIRAVYSDSPLDFYPGAKSFLVLENNEIHISR